ncbi:phage antirepressor KilAC domain-containing protein [Streptobacillus moniliformis]|uniref:phage antirepressor KilAC domain-containing protein n=1 Tax=Streptobacillus moniliformis TaxID=34105 RepID=UPI0007E47751|nr:phage antirepressor KilAC domain-containing protein [Streptobacillus moniliformis]
MELIEIKTNEKLEPIISLRELHTKLEITERYSSWTERMFKYGFNENEDYSGCKVFNTLANQELIDHNITIDMAKEICMLQRNEIGKKFRKYFIEVEKEFNSPEKIMARAVLIANDKVKKLDVKVQELENKVENLTLDNAVKGQQIQELKPKATYYDLVLQCTSLLSVSVIAKDYGMSATALNDKLHELGIQYKLSGVWLLYAKYQDKGYTGTKTHTYVDNKGKTQGTPHTYWTQKGRLFIYELLKKEGILPTIERNDKEVI